MRSLTRTAVIQGSETELVAIECTTTSGFAGLQLVGNIGELCREGKERAKTVLENLGFKFGHKRILINFSPADCRKEGNHFDLPLAVSLAAQLSDETWIHDTNDWLFAAELGLDGSLRPCRRVIPLAIKAIAGGLKGMICAAGNRQELSILRQISESHQKSFQFHFFHSMEEVLHFLYRGMSQQATQEAFCSEIEETIRVNFEDMRLSPELKELAAVVAIGRHSLLLSGTPGSGKSMFSQRLASLLPPLEERTHLEALEIHSLQDENLDPRLLAGLAPFRQPHHTAHPHAILGSGDKPGEISLSHGGILFLDELPEFRRDLLESLREPLETKKIHISRTHQKSTWLADVQLIAACNACPCGYLGSKRRLCRCSTQKLLAYQNRLSGPLLERIDIHFLMPEFQGQELLDERTSEIEPWLDKIAKARTFMFERWGRRMSNSEASIEEIFQSSGKDKKTLLSSLEKDAFSSRSLLRILRVARTLADLQLRKEIYQAEIQKAASWRPSRLN